MSVDDWSRQEAEQYAHGDVYGDIQLGFRAGVASLADALLSDEAVEAVAESFYNSQTATWGKYFTSVYKSNWDKVARAALQAAVDAVTKEARND